MVGSKHFTVFVIIAMTFATILCFAAIIYADHAGVRTDEKGVSMDYETALFDTDQIITIDIQIKPDKWNKMLENAINEEYADCDVVINGEKITKVAIRPKGNTSLFAIAMDPTSERYSLKLEFDHYIEGQTCHGLDKLILNNGFMDASNLREAVVFDMYKYIETDASLYNFAKVSVNGEYWGVYTALEAVESSFIDRNYGTTLGKLYKPESSNMDAIKDQINGNVLLPPDESAKTTIKLGADLNYTDDDLDSYANIWNNEMTKAGNADERRVVNALKNIKEGKNLEEYMDVDNILKYMAVHTFVVNMDSLSGQMGHNYYLYEFDGRLRIIPWDYNLAFGGMSLGEDYGAADVVNYPIDTPFDITRFFDPLLENEEYCNRYHAYLKQLCDGYVYGGKLDEFYERVRDQIDELAEDDPTAFYSYEEYLEATTTLYDIIKLRAESVIGQIDGTVPATKDVQEKSPELLVDASGVDLEATGLFEMEGEAAAGLGMTEDMQGGAQPQNSQMGPPEDGQMGPPQNGQMGPPQGGQQMVMGNMIDPNTGMPVLQLAMIKDMAFCIAYFILMLLMVIIVKNIRIR